MNAEVNPEIVAKTFPQPEFVGIMGGTTSADSGMYGNPLSTILPLPDGSFRIYLCRRFWFEDKTTRFEQGYIETESLTEWPDLSESFNTLSIEGMPENCMCAQPIVIPAGDGYEAFFWIHGNGMVRYVKAASDDGINFKILNLVSPCLYHPADLAVKKDDSAEALLTFKNRTPSQIPEDVRPLPEREALVSNDATNVFYDEVTKEYVMHSVLLIPSADMPERRVEFDNAAEWLRIIHRRASKDGLDWSAAENVVLPSSNDPVDLQFYSLITAKAPGSYLGILGYYPAAEQTMDLEPVISSDGRSWIRQGFPWNLRDKADLDGREIKMLFPGAMLEHEGHVYITANACSYLHNEIGKLSPHEYVQGILLFRL